MGGVVGQVSVVEQQQGRAGARRGERQQQVSSLYDRELVPSRVRLGLVGFHEVPVELGRQAGERLGCAGLREPQLHYQLRELLRIADLEVGEEVADGLGEGAERPGMIRAEMRFEDCDSFGPSCAGHFLDEARLSAARLGFEEDGRTDTGIARLGKKFAKCRQLLVTPYESALGEARLVCDRTAERGVGRQRASAQRR